MRNIGWHLPWWHGGEIMQYILIFNLFVFKRETILAFVEYH